VVVVQQRQGADGHDLGDGAEAKHVAVAQAVHELDAVRQVLQRVDHLLV
jgi:hypothetical protein